MKWGLLLLLGVPLTARAGTLDVWADDLVARVAPSLPAGRDVGLAVHARDAGGARLAEALAGLVLARLPAGAGVRTAAALESPAVARAGGFAALLDVEVALDGGDAVATLRVLPTERDFWREAAGAVTAGAVRASGVARVRVDAELRSYVTAALPPATQPVTPARPRRLTWRALRAGLDLGAPLLALQAADLDGDGSAELIALTVSEVVVLRVLGDGVAVMTRARLDGAPPVPRPRWPVGSLAVTGRDIAARSSEHAAGAVFAYASGTLTRTGEPRDYPTCSGAVALAPGMALFERDGGRVLAVGCGGGLVAAVDAAGSLSLARVGETKPFTAVAGVGAAFAIADVDGDGVPEVVASGWRPPGTRDTLSVLRVGEGVAARTAGRATPVAPIAGVAAGDFDGDGTIDVLAASRAAGDETRYEAWLLE